MASLQTSEGEEDSCHSKYTIAHVPGVSDQRLCSELGLLRP
jgi:hypothetical protein